MFALIAAETNDEKLYSKREQFKNPAVCHLLLCKEPYRCRPRQKIYMDFERKPSVSYKLFRSGTF
jgi:hypothetical protein